MDFEIPINSPDDVWNIASPEEWSYEFISFNEYKARFGEPNPFMSPYVLHWYTGYGASGDLMISATGIVLLAKPIVPSGYNQTFGTSFYELQADGFIICSNLSPVDGPYLVSWQDEFRNIGDPPLPGGNVGGGGTPPFNPIPLPASIILVLTGLGGLAYARRKIRS